MAVIGAVLGDIAGVPYEFRRPKDLDWKQCRLFSEESHFSDDTVLTLATKAAVLNGMPFDDTFRAFGLKYIEAGYGGSFKAWLKDATIGPYGSYGNGSAMRCSFIGEHFNTEKEVKEWAEKSAECTHNHPEGIKGAIVTAMCVFMARTGATKAEIKAYVASEYPASDYAYGVSRPLSEYRDSYKWSVTCQDSVPVAIRCFLESSHYESFLRNVLSLPCDTDTLCAIGGGIAEEYYGMTGFNARKILREHLDDRLFGLVFL